MFYIRVNIFKLIKNTTMKTFFFKYILFINPIIRNKVNFFEALFKNKFRY